MSVKEYLQKLNEKIIYIPNPGNAGDNMIILGTIHLFKKLGVEYEIGHWQKKYKGKHLIYGGGGNLIGRYPACRLFLESNKIHNRITVLPHTIQKEVKLLKSLKEDTVIFCREEVSKEYVRRIAPQVNTFIDHDLALQINSDFITPEKGKGILYAYRQDVERSNKVIPVGNKDLSLIYMEKDYGLSEELPKKIQAYAKYYHEAQIGVSKKEIK